MGCPVFHMLLVQLSRHDTVSETGSTTSLKDETTQRAPTWPTWVLDEGRHGILWPRVLPKHLFFNLRVCPHVYDCVSMCIRCVRTYICACKPRYTGALVCVCEGQRIAWMLVLSSDGVSCSKVPVPGKFSTKLLGIFLVLTLASPYEWWDYRLIATTQDFMWLLEIWI